jgi:hypothetical protein
MATVEQQPVLPSLFPGSAILANAPAFTSSGDSGYLRQLLEENPALVGQEAANVRLAQMPVLIKLPLCPLAGFVGVSNWREHAMASGSYRRA